jgi:hypothetical protein
MAAARASKGACRGIAAHRFHVFLPSIITFLVERLGSCLLKRSVISLNAFGNRHQAVCDLCCDEALPCRACCTVSLGACKLWRLGSPASDDHCPAEVLGEFVLFGNLDRVNDMAPRSYGVHQNRF